MISVDDNDDNDDNDENDGNDDNDGEKPDKRWSNSDPHTDTCSPALPNLSTWSSVSCIAGYAHDEYDSHSDTDDPDYDKEHDHDRDDNDHDHDYVQEDGEFTLL